MTDTIRNVTAENFDANVARADRPVLVDFYADWCGPCQAVAPVLRDLAAEYLGRVDVLKVNVDQQPELAGRYGIRSIPTLVVFNGGEVADVHVGGGSRRALGDLLARHAVGH